MAILGYVFVGFLIFSIMFLLGWYVGIKSTVWILVKKKEEGVLHEWLEEMTNDK